MLGHDQKRESVTFTPFVVNQSSGWQTTVIKMIHGDESRLLLTASTFSFEYVFYTSLMSALSSVLASFTQMHLRAFPSPPPCGSLPPLSPLDSAFAFRWTQNNTRFNLQVNQDDVFRRSKVSLFGLLDTNQAGNSCNSWNTALHSPPLNLYHCLEQRQEQEIRKFIVLWETLECLILKHGSLKQPEGWQVWWFPSMKGSLLPL